MKPSFTEYNSIASDACQILAIAEIQYSDGNGCVFNETRAGLCRTMRLAIGSAILEVGHQLQNKKYDSTQLVEEAAISKLKPPFYELSRKLADITSEMRIAVNSNKSKSFLAEVMFSDKSEYSIYNLSRLQTNLSLLLHQEKESGERSHGYSGIKLTTNIFMQPLSAVDCETKANDKLSDFIASRVEQTVRIETMMHSPVAADAKTETAKSVSN